MESPLQKYSDLDLPRQISNLLRQRILNGEYQPGYRMGGVRQSAAEFAVSPVTFLKALDILAAERLIERVPGKGIFVSRRVCRPERRLKVCYAFPEKSLESLAGSPENYSSSSELYRGMIDGAAAVGADLQFSYFENQVSPAQLQRQLDEISRFDFVIFPSFQLMELQRLAAAVMPVFRICNRTETVPEGVIAVDYDRVDARARLFELYRGSGCRSAAVIASRKRFRSEEFIARVRAAGGAVAGDGFQLVPEDDWFDSLPVLKDFLARQRPEFIFVDFTNITGLVYEAAMDLGLRVGRDFQITGIACGTHLLNLLPRYTFLRIPFYEYGRQIIESGAAFIRSGAAVELPVFRVELIRGRSVILPEPLSSEATPNDHINNFNRQEDMEKITVSRQE